MYFILLHAGPASTRHEIAAPETSRGKPLLSLEDIEYVQTKDGENEWRLIAQQAAYIKSQDVTTFKQVHFIYYLQDQQELHLTGETGEMNLKDRSISVHGDVNVDLGDRVRLETDQMFYDDTSKEIWTPGEVRIRSRQCLLKGKGMRAQVDQRRFLLEDNVEAKIFPQTVR
ncbi:MAG: LPS export ABC transporter periplasmic protein LptC [Deltaproteobacteria bacterium]|nr:LPS export ABC transporter periplasmic protein LptC [Deltaproteobacteria bacterium]